MRNDFLGNTAGVAADAGCIQLHRAVESFRRCLQGIDTPLVRFDILAWWHLSNTPEPLICTWHSTRLRRCFGIELLAGDIRFHQQPRRFCVGKRQNLPGA